jgi:hypothetical protein
MKTLVVVLTFVMALAGSAVADTAEDIVAWYKVYAQLWDKADVNIDAVERYYAVPGYFVGSDGALAAPTAEAHKSTMVAFVDGLKQKGWAGSKLLSVRANVLNPSAAFVETEWTDYATDGTPLEGCKVALYTYLAAKTTEGWKFLSAHVGPCKSR